MDSGWVGYRVQGWHRRDVVERQGLKVSAFRILAVFGPQFADSLSLALTFRKLKMLSEMRQATSVQRHKVPVAFMCVRGV